MGEMFSLFVKDFTHLDGAILDPIRGPVGMSYILGIEFIGQLNDESVVFDFSHAKKLAKRVVDETADHALTVGANDIVVDKNSDMCHVESDTFSYLAPVQAFFIIANPTELCLFQTLEEKIFNACKSSKDCEGLKCVKLHPKLEQVTDDNKYFYCYTHGLKQHDGNCQRLIHGHRSTVNISVDGVRRPDLEKLVCEFFHDKHFAFKDNTSIMHVDSIFGIKYTSSQGDFMARLPFDMCIHFPIETTVENISKYIAHFVISRIDSFSKIDVYAYEGIDKGCKYSLTPSKIDKSLYEHLDSILKG